MKVVMTWPADDVSIDLDGHILILSEEPEMGSHTYGVVRQGWFGLTIAKAKKLSQDLLACANRAEEMNQECIDYFKAWEQAKKEE